MSDDEGLAAVELPAGFRAKSTRHDGGDLVNRNGLRSNGNLLIEIGKSCFEPPFVIVARRRNKAIECLAFPATFINPIAVRLLAVYLPRRVFEQLIKIGGHAIRIYIEDDLYLCRNRRVGVEARMLRGPLRIRHVAEIARIRVARVF